MDHNRAVDSLAVERYLLSEMSPEERDAFEEHYFTCAACAADVRAAARFHEEGRDYFAAPRRPLREAAEAVRPRRWWSLPQLAPVAASIALAGVVVYLAGFEIPELKRSIRNMSKVQPMVSVTLREVTRGSDIERIPHGGDFFSVYFDVPASGAKSYQYSVTDASGNVTAKDQAPMPAGAEPANLLFPRSNFPGGQYTITIRDGNTVVSQHKFVVE